jgi:CheY-like chemotaxis protein
MTHAISRAPGSHAVQFYAEAHFPLWSVAGFLAEGIRHDRPAVMLTTRPLYDAVAGRLGLAADDGTSESGGPLVFVDTDETIATFMDGPVPDFTRFHRAIAGISDRLQRRHGAGPVWLYGEMAGRLHRLGKRAAALAIETEWESRYAGRDIAVICGYPTKQGVPEGDLDAICGHHRHVFAAGDARDESTVYIVDDDPSIRRSLGRLLKSAGLRVQTFASAEAFLALGDPMANGCMLLDVQLAGMSGSDLQRHMSHFLGAMPVIAMSGATDVQIERLSMELGASAFLRKPFNSRTLMETLARVLVA